MASEVPPGNKTEYRLVISDIEASNLGVGASKEHKSKEQYVTASLKGLSDNVLFDSE